MGPTQAPPAPTQTPEVKEEELSPAPATPATPTPPAAAPVETKAKGYKRPMWQWIAIYAVIAVVVYALIYFLFIRKSGTSSY